MYNKIRGHLPSALIDLDAAFVGAEIAVISIGNPSFYHIYRLYLQVIIQSPQFQSSALLGFGNR